MAPPGKPVGGIDFGFRNPFAAIWGTVRDDVLHIDHELYLRETPLSRIVPQLPNNVLWAADPAGAVEISELRIAGFKVLKGKNDIRPGISAVKARLQTDRLKINEHTCPNLFAEAKLYRYPQGGERGAGTENPVDENNHALAALRYLVSRLDARAFAKFRRSTPVEEGTITETETNESLETIHELPPARKSIDIKDDRLWTPL